MKFIVLKCYIRFSMNEMELKYTSFAEHSTPGTFEIYNDVKEYGSQTEGLRQSVSNVLGQMPQKPLISKHVNPPPPLSTPLCCVPFFVKFDVVWYVNRGSNIDWRGEILYVTYCNDPLTF
jgi:hypothetical protein